MGFHFLPIFPQSNTHDYVQKATTASSLPCLTTTTTRAPAPTSRATTTALVTTVPALPTPTRTTTPTLMGLTTIPTRTVRPTTTMAKVALCITPQADSLRATVPDLRSRETLHYA